MLVVAVAVIGVVALVAGTVKAVRDIRAAMRVDGRFCRIKVGTESLMVVGVRLDMVMVVAEVGDAGSRGQMREMSMPHPVHPQSNKYKLDLC